MITPARVGTAHATLTLQGEGLPLTVPLTATARAAPAIRLLVAARRRCPAPGAPALVVLTSEPASLGWHAVRLAPATPCGPSAGSRGAPSLPAGGSGRTSAVGAVATGSVIRVRSGRRGCLAALRLGGGLSPGRYQVTVTHSDGHGPGRPQTVSITVGPAGAL